MKTKAILLFIYSAMSACTYNEELSETTMPGTTEEVTDIQCTMPTLFCTEKAYENPQIPNEAFAKVQICIINQMPDLHLEITSIKICNISLKGTYHPPTEYHTGYWETDTAKTSLTIETEPLKVGSKEKVLIPNYGNIFFIPQTIKAWNTSELPHANSQCYLLMNCMIYQPDTKEMVWSSANGNCAEVAIPIDIHFQSNTQSLIILKMAPNCPWYDISGTYPYALFVPITFDASVENWTSSR